MKRKGNISFLFFIVFCILGLMSPQNLMGQTPNCNQGRQDKIDLTNLYKTIGDLLVSIFIQSTQPVDPNEIIGLDGFDVAGSVDTFRWVSATQTLAYTVYFENDADFATAAASKVTINVPLHPKLNYATLGIGSFGFGSHVFAVEGSPSSYQTRIDLRDSLGIFVDVVAGLDIVHNEAFWIFQSIDPATGLPPTDINMGFLPINDSLHSGEGFVTFTIKPQTNDCLTGDTVTATASIVFDVNEAIPTNTWLHTIDAFPPTSTLHMVPNGADQLTATFSGEDDEGGCGIKQFKLYCSQNEGAYQLYAIYQVGTTPQIPLETGIEYRFFVLAEDNVGNCEPMKSQPEFTIGTNFVTLAVNSFPAEAGSTTGAGTYSVNETAQLTATAAEGYHFVHWMQQGAIVSTQDPYSLSVTQNQTYTAYFERDAYTLQTVAEEGSVITVTDIYGNEIPSGSTIYHSDRLIVSTDTLSCYQMTGCLLNGNTYAPGDTLTINGDVQIVTQTLSNHDYTEFSEEVCESYTWNGITYIQSSDYTQTFTSTSGCDSVVTLHLTVHHATYVDTTAIACGSFEWYGSTYTSSGSYQSYLTNASGCDSIVTLHLTINHGDYAEVYVDTCGTEFFWEVSGQSYDRSDTYYFFSDNTNNCQDTIALFLSLHQPAVTELAAQICEGDTYSQNGFNVSEAGDYEQHLQTVFGCDSTVILHLTVDNETVTNIAASICEGEDYVDNGFEIIAPEAGVREYSDTIHRQGTCDSIVVLHLTVNTTTYGDTTVTACDSFTWHDITYTSSGSYQSYLTNASGCDSIVTLHLTITQPTYGDTTVIACNSFTWHGITYTSSGSYQSYLTTAAGCDSIVTLHLTINHGDYAEVTVDTCGTEFLWEVSGQSYDHSGTYYHYSNNANGCQDTTVLVLTLHQATVTELAAQICEGEVYDQNGFNVSTAGDHHLNLQTAHGCDSTVILHLAVGSEAVTNLSASICEGENYTDNGFAIIAPAVGTDEYRDTIHRQGACDSIVVLHLTINQPTYGDTTVIACDSFTWHDITYTSSGSYQSHLTNAAGCDSIVTLHLTVNQPTYGDTTVTACDSFTWHDITYTSSGSYQSHLTNANGCDSLVTLHLTINHGDYAVVTVDTCGTEFFWTMSGQSYDHSGTYYHYSNNASGCQDTTVMLLTLHQSTVTELAAQICEGEVYDQNGFNVSTAGDHYLNLQTAHGCDSTVILHLAVGSEAVTYLSASICEGENYTDNGFAIIAPEAGTGEYRDTIHRQGTCDSVVVLHLTVNATTYGDTTVIACDSFTWHDITYTSSGSYQSYLTNAAGCDSIVTLHLTINQPTYGDTTAIACDSFTWHDSTYTSSGSYQSYLSNAAGCDSIVTLHLTVNHGNYAEVTVDTCGTEFFWEVSGQSYDHSGTYYHYSNNASGCQDTTVLALTLHQSTVTELAAQICEGEVYDQNGFTVSTAGDHHLNLQTAHGCDSTVILHLAVGSEAVTYLSASICEGDSYQENGFEIIAPSVGTYMYSDTIARLGTCDSVISLTLTVNSATYGDTTAVVNSSFDWYGQHLTTSGDYTSTFTNAAGCDSVVTLHLTVNYSGTGDTTAIACDRFDWYEHMNLTQSGEYMHTFTNIAGGDSVVTLHLTVNHSVTEIVEATACDSYTWNGITYTQSVNYTQTFTNASGCDSTITLHLTINHSVAEHIEATACDSFTWHGITYTSSGSYQSHLTNTAGCDSIVTLHLTINQPTYGDTTVIACDSFTWHDITYTSSGSYQSHLTNAAGCDSTFTLHLTLVEAPALQAISGETAVCINQFATYYYDASDPDYHYRWFKDNALWAENVSRVMLHEMGEGSVLLTMQVSDNQYGCLADTSLTVLVLNHVAPDTTEIRRKANSNILVCAPVTSEYGQVHYRWGYTDIHTGSETVMPGDRNYCLYNIGIDTLSYRYWVETYLSEPIGEGCDNRSYYGQGVMTSTSDYDANIVEAYMSNNCIVLNVNALYPSNITATLYDVNGKHLLMREYGTAETVSDIIPISYAPGVYFLKVMVGNQLYAFKLLKI